MDTTDMGLDERKDVAEYGGNAEKLLWPLHKVLKNAEASFIVIDNEAINEDLRDLVVSASKVCADADCELRMIEHRINKLVYECE